MFRNARYGGWLAAIVTLVLLAIVGFGAFQFGVVQGAGGEIVPHMMQEGYRTVNVFPFFWGFSFLRFGFTLLFIFLFVRLLFAPMRWMRRGGPWGQNRREEMHGHLKEMHDRWHAEHPESGASPTTGEE